METTTKTSKSEFSDQKTSSEVQMRGILNAIDASFASIEFDTGGNILEANELFLETVGYKLDEIVGKHHRIFCDEAYTKSKDYEKFWKDLGDGKAIDGEFQRFGKGGKEVWLQAAYTPVLDNGKVVRVIKFAQDITKKKLENADFQGQIEAVSKAQAIVQFNLDGTIITANDNFLSTVGYTLEEVQGKHHRMFVDEQYAKSKEYKDFWAKLNKGEYEGGQFKRIGKDGKEIWLEASYNPIMDMNGNPFKVVKYATDITADVIAKLNAQGIRETVDNSFAYIEFDPQGNILDANSNFVSTLKYTDASEIKGSHHSIFVDEEYKASGDYKKFWDDLRNGMTQNGQFKRTCKDGSEVWIQAAYTPLKDDSGKVVKVIKIATDVTEDVIDKMNMKGVKDTVDTSFAYIEFDPKGNILDANDNFIRVLGYSNVKEFEGAHHSMFVDDQYRRSSEYTKFWDDLGNGISQVGEFARVKKDGETAWIQAAYTPVKDETGNVIKVIKIATEITEQKRLEALAEKQLEMLQVAQEEMQSAVAALAKGDLTQKVDLEKMGDLEEMGVALNQAIDSLNDVLGTVNANALNVGTSAQQMLDSSEEMSKATLDVASAVEQIAQGSQNQAEQTDNVSKLVEEMRKSSESVAEQLTSVNQAASEGEENAKKGKELVQSVVKNIEEISDSASSTSNSIKVLTKRSEEITKTLSVITDIAGQTNLLALNAAIEAARAGEAGRGFAVVAEEIRKLAEGSRKSAGDIDTLVGDVQADTAAAAKAIEQMSVNVEKGRESTNAASKSFEEISVYSRQTLSQTKEIMQLTESQKQNMDQVFKSIEQIVVVAEETAAGTQQVSATAQQLSSAMEEFSGASRSLTGISEDLLEGVGTFDLSEEAKAQKVL
ncbi:MAG: PAS domain S-box protein, partial [Bacteroidetes bacterium]|nr:PAS domain S-box protein [Bacteroidota bacterium]